MRINGSENPYKRPRPYRPPRRRRLRSRRIRSSNASQARMANRIVPPKLCLYCGATDAYETNKRIIGEDDGARALIAWCNACQNAGPADHIDPTPADLLWLLEPDSPAVN